MPPSEEGRYQILSLQCKPMAKSNRLVRPNLSTDGRESFLRSLAADTPGFTGADLAGLVRSASSRALARAHEAAGIADGSWEGVECVVTAEDFTQVSSSATGPLIDRD